MRALLVTAVVLLLTGCGGGAAYIPGSAGGYKSQALSTEKGQLLLGRQTCNLVAWGSGPEEVVQSLAGEGPLKSDEETKIDRAEAQRFVDESLAQCDYLRSAEVKDRLVALGEGQWVS